MKKSSLEVLRSHERVDIKLISVCEDLKAMGTSDLRPQSKPRSAPLGPMKVGLPINPTGLRNV